MPPKPSEQTSPKELALAHAVSSKTFTPTSSPVRRHGGRGSSDDDDDAASGLLPVYVRFKDLVDARIVASWPSLLRLIETQNFPQGVMLSRNTRAWRLDEVEDWLASRPTARKIVPPRKQQVAA